MATCGRAAVSTSSSWDSFKGGQTTAPRGPRASVPAAARVSMGDYTVNADDLFSSDEDGAEPAAPLHLPSPKRQRAAAPPPSLGNIRLSSFGGGQGGPPRGPPSCAPAAPGFSARGPPGQHSQNGFTPGRYGQNAHQQRPPPPRMQQRQPPPRMQQRQPPRHIQQRQPQAFQQHRPQSQFQDQRHGLPAMGRGRGATLPAHVTAGRAPPMHPSIQKQEQPRKALSGAASILPEHDRERVLQATKKVFESATPVERKRPGARRKRAPSAGGSDVGSESARMAAAAAHATGPVFGGLQALMAGAQGSLISLDPDRGRGKTTKAEPERPIKRARTQDVYARISMTKEVVEREARKAASDRRELEEKFARLREEERDELASLADKMRANPTVAAGMRDAYTLDRVERHLFDDPEGRKKRDTLEFAGLKLAEGEADEESTRLMTVEVLEF